jgi:release factor glutamine methyltransferase
VPSWRELRAATAARLVAAGTDAGTASLEARWLCEEASGIPHGDWERDCGELATERTFATLERMVVRRVGGEPLAHVLGSWSFRTLELMVDARVLVPRPETEHVVEVAIGLARSMTPPIIVADLGTGSGAIGLSLAAELAVGSVEVWATDVSDEALEVARANLAGLGRRGGCVHMRAGSWWDALPADRAGRLDLVVSNPPYVASGDDLDDSVRRWEPPTALFAGADGLDAVRVLAAGAPGWLRPGGWLVVEIGAAHGEGAAALALGAGLVDVDVQPDLAGRDRVLVARRP